MFATLEEHNANPPSTWTVEKAAPRIWHLNTSSGGTLDYFSTKKAAEAAKVTGHLVRAYEAEGRWMGGETPPGHHSYAACLAKRDRVAARWCKEASHHNCTHGCHPDVEDHTDCTNPSCSAPDEPGFCYNHQEPCPQPCADCQADCDPKLLGTLDFDPRSTVFGS